MDKTQGLTGICLRAIFKMESKQSRKQWLSYICLLYSSPKDKQNEIKKGGEREGGEREI